MMGREGQLGRRDNRRGRGHPFTRASTCSGAPLRTNLARPAGCIPAAFAASALSSPTRHLSGTSTIADHPIRSDRSVTLIAGGAVPRLLFVASEKTSGYRIFSKGHSDRRRPSADRRHERRQGQRSDHLPRQVVRRHRCRRRHGDGDRLHVRPGVDARGESQAQAAIGRPFAAPFARRYRRSNRGRRDHSRAHSQAGEAQGEAEGERVRDAAHGAQARARVRGPPDGSPLPKLGRDPPARRRDDDHRAGDAPAFGTPRAGCATTTVQGRGVGVGRTRGRRGIGGERVVHPVPRKDQVHNPARQVARRRRAPARRRQPLQAHRVHPQPRRHGREVKAPTRRPEG